eukprot:6214458-Pleurochrysis_carterae.AAC.14
MGGGLPRNGKPNCTLICALHFTQADHTIATARASESTGRSNEKLIPALEVSKARKTPSPTAKLPSPTNARVKACSPTASQRVTTEKKSPNSSQRLSPTSGKGRLSPTESSKVSRLEQRPVRKGHSPDVHMQRARDTRCAAPAGHLPLIKACLIS